MEEPINELAPVLDHCASVSASARRAMEALIAFSVAVNAGAEVDQAAVKTWAEAAKDLLAVLERLDDLTATLRLHL